MNKNIKQKICPVCGSDGFSGTYFDRMIDKWVTNFGCDKSKEHHFLIIELKPYEIVELQSLETG